MTCAQFRDQVVAMARGLVAAGIAARRAGRPDEQDAVRVDAARLRDLGGGAVTVPIYETSSAEQVAWILADSGAVACFVETTAHALLLAGLRDQLPELAQVWQIEVGDLGGA